MKMNQEYFNDKVKNGFNDTKFSDIDKEDLFNKTQKGAIAEFFDDINDLYSLCKDYFSGTYKDVSVATIATILGTFGYIIFPLDIIPDIIPILGWIDDALCVRFCLSALEKEITKYRIWKKNPIIDV